MKKRAHDWGRDAYDARVSTALAAFLEHARSWMVIERSCGPEAVAAVYCATLEGVNSPELGHILRLAR